MPAPEALQETLIKLVEKMYVQADKGTGFGNIHDLAEKYDNRSRTLEENIDSLIFWAKAKTSAGGALSSLPAVIPGVGTWLTVAAVPADMVNLLYHNMRAALAIGLLCGFDYKKDRHVKTMALSSLGLVDIRDFVSKKAMLVNGAEVVVEKLLKAMPQVFYDELVRLIGANLAAKLGANTATRFAKVVPVVGCLVSAGMDAWFTAEVCRKAKENFLVLKNGTSALVTKG